MAKRRNEDGTLNVYQDRANYSEQTIQKVLYEHFGKMNYATSNFFVFGNWESDFFFMSKSKMLWEIEIKVDRQDYERDFQLKPKKHRLYSEIYESGDRNGNIVPNHYYFCAPEGVIQKETLPPYAGLLEIGGPNKDKIKYATPTTKIHGDKMDVDALLLSKLYASKLKLEKLLMDYRIKLFEAKGNTDAQVEATEKFLKTIRM